jgi:hypothetical protein
LAFGFGLAFGWGLGLGFAGAFFFGAGFFGAGFFFAGRDFFPSTFAIFISPRKMNRRRLLDLVFEHNA